jgi:hypothetical protein
MDVMFLYHAIIVVLQERVLVFEVQYKYSVPGCCIFSFSAFFFKRKDSFSFYGHSNGGLLPRTTGISAHLIGAYLMTTQTELFTTHKRHA